MEQYIGTDTDGFNHYFTLLPDGVILRACRPDGMMLVQPRYGEDALKALKRLYELLEKSPPAEND